MSFQCGQLLTESKNKPNGTHQLLNICKLEQNNDISQYSDE